MAEKRHPDLVAKAQGMMQHNHRMLEKMRRELRQIKRLSTLQNLKSSPSPSHELDPELQSWFTAGYWF